MAARAAPAEQGTDKVEIAKEGSSDSSAGERSASWLARAGVSPCRNSGAPS